MSDAIQVPCTPQFAFVGGVFTPEKSRPVVTEPVRSETCPFTPLSIKATVTPDP